MNVITRALASLKAAFTMHFQRSGAWGSWLMPGLSYDYSRAVGDGRSNSAIWASIRYAQRTIPEAPLVVMQRDAQGEQKPIPDHPLQLLIDRPNPFYSGLHLLGAVIADLMFGNAYLIKVRSGQKRVVELWWVPATMIEPKWPEDGTTFIGWYEYTVDGQVLRLDPSDVVHLRQGINPDNIRLGMSDLEALLREVATDNEAASWTAAMLRNGAVPGVVISPEGDVSASESDLEEVKTKFVQRFGGDQRGQPLVMKGPTKVQVLSFSPEQMNLRSLRQIPEERVCAVLGIPAAVIGLGAGLDTTKVGATMREMREQAFESFVIPLQRLIRAELMAQLVPDFGDLSRLSIEFDLSEVRVLQDDQNALHERARADLTAGLLTLNQALQMIGEEPVEGEAGDVRYLPNTVTVKTLADLIAVPEPVPAALVPPTPLRALPAPPEADQPVVPDAEKAKGASIMKALFADELVTRYEDGLSTLADDLADELLGAFDEIAEVAAGRALSQLKMESAAVETKADDVRSLVTAADHEPIRRLLRSYVLKGVRQAAEDLAPLTGDAPVRITRNMPAVRAAIADMESRLPGIIETTDADFGRLIARLGRRPGSVSLEDVKAALLDYVAESYPGRAAAIARTELGYAHARGVLLVAEKSGLADRVHVHDGDGDAVCRERNGTTATLEEAAGIGLLHPNCSLRLVPIVEAA
jgi:HK97 family phage portal protein